MGKKIKGVRIPAILFSIFLVIFPVDSALGELLGTISINNYIAIACVAISILFFSSKIIFRRNYFVEILIIYILFQIISILHGGNFFSDRNIIFMFYSFMAILLMHFQWTDYEKRMFCSAILLGVILTCVIVLVNVDFGSSGRLYLSLGRNIDQNYLCANLIFGTALIVNSLFYIKKLSWRILLFAILATELLCIAFLGSRGSLIGNFVVVIVAFWINRNKLKTRQKIIVISALIIVLLITSNTMQTLLPEWILERYNILNMLKSDGSGRLTIWQNYFEYYEDGSIWNTIMGFGRGIIYHFQVSGVRKCTHSIYLKALVEGGLIGISLLILLMGAVVYYINKSKNWILLAFVVGYCVCGVFLDLDDYRIFPVLILLIGIFSNCPYCVKSGGGYGINNSSNI